MPRTDGYIRSSRVCPIAKSCPTFHSPVDCSLLSPPGSSVHGIAQARILEWVAVSFSRVIPNPGSKPTSPSPADRSFTSEPHGKTYLWKVGIDKREFYPEFPRKLGPIENFISDF